jgi:Fe2+ transport system protein B
MKQKVISFLLGAFVGNKLAPFAIHVTYLTLILWAFLVGLVFPTEKILGVFQ